MPNSSLVAVLSARGSLRVLLLVLFLAPWLGCGGGRVAAPPDAGPAAVEPDGAAPEAEEEPEGPSDTLTGGELPAPTAARAGEGGVDAGVPEALPEVLFVDATVESGLTFSHFTGAFGEKYMPETVGSGGCLFDYDGDGDLDIFLVNGNHWPERERDRVHTPALYVNDGAGRFRDATDEAGLGSLSIYGMGCAVGDYDDDGDLDLYVTAVGDNVLLRNDEGVFRDVAAEAGVRGRIPGEDRPIWSTAAVWTDYDGDGWLDLFVGNYVRWTPEDDRFTSLDGETKTYATPEVYPGETSLLYRNLGDGTFRDVTREAGIWATGKAMSAVAVELDGLHGPELVVTNDTEPNHLFVNGGDGTFEELGVVSGIGYDESGKARAGMGVDVAHLGAGEEQAIAIGNFNGEALSLYTQVGDGFFEDRARATRLLPPTIAPLTFGVLWFDADLDGDLDLLTVNGHIEPEIARFAAGVSFRQPAQLFLNQGDGTFAEAERCGELCSLAVVGRSVAVGDVDRDGDLDLLITENGGPARLWRNLASDRGARSLRIELRGTSPNRQAIGARVTAWMGDRAQRREVRTGGSYLAQSDLAMTFGLGDRDRVDRLRIVWPSGEVQEVEGLMAGCAYRVAQGAAPQRHSCWREAGR
jgi:enediyne biosynthesis protein E4